MTNSLTCMDGKTFNFPKDYWFSDFRVLISGPETPGLVQSLAKECRVDVMNYKSVREPHWCVNITVPVLVYEELTLDNIPAKNAGWDSILWFALTIDGYEVPDQKNFRNLQCVLDPGDKPSMTELRTALFHFQRGWWWNGGQSLEDLELALIRRVIGETRHRVADREFD